MKYVCGFFAVNKKHCVPNGLKHCVVCRAKVIKINVKTPPEPKPYDPRTFRVLTKEDMILYNPSLVSRRRRVIMA